MSYNAAGVLAHIASDGPSDWTIDTPSRDEVLSRMSRAIERWNLNTERNINYRSFEPILGLVRCYETPECQHWAVWALANLTKVRICVHLSLSPSIIFFSLIIIMNCFHCLFVHRYIHQSTAS